MKLLNTKDYGLKAYVLLKTDGKKCKQGVMVNDDVDTVKLVKEYERSEFSVYNKILKEILKDK